MIIYRELVPAVCAIAREAAELILTHYAQPITHERKADHSPVTLADTESNTLIVARLQALTPHIPVVSEEGDQLPNTADATFWLVDPLDGTRSYIARDDEFSVNIALVEKTIPVLGVLAIPAKQLLYYAVRNGDAWRQEGNQQPEKIHCRVPSAEGLAVITSKAYGLPKTEAFLSQYNVVQRVKAGSAYKFARVAEGAADFYPRLGKTMEWDTAAGQCILEAAGGCVTTLDGQKLYYGKSGYLNPGFLAWGSKVVEPLSRV